MAANYTKGEWTLFEHGITSQIMCGKYKVAEGIYNKANAYLIAATPDMYEALQLWTSHNQGTRGHYCSECAIAIEKALAKAKGMNA